MSQTPTGITFGDESPADRVYNLNHGKLLDLTPEAVAKVREFSQKNDKAQGKTFRVYVEGGGCSGMQYGFTFDERKDDDDVVPCGDIEVLVDKNSISYLKGAVVDYVEGLSGAGFVVENPLAKASCGCGTSFTV